MPERPNMWYIFEKRIVQGYEKLYSHVPNTQIQKYNYTNMQTQHMTKCQKVSLSGIFLRKKRIVLYFFSTLGHFQFWGISCATLHCNKNQPGKTGWEEEWKPKNLIAFPLVISSGSLLWYFEENLSDWNIKVNKSEHVHTSHLLIHLLTRTHCQKDL